MKRLQNKHVLMGICGSIAAYKACDVVRRLQSEGAEVNVVMTDAARHFVAPLTFETLTNADVVTGLFGQQHVMRTRHIQLAEWADCMLICPATANMMAKAAAGIADDMLSTIITAARSPVIFAPAMDFQMITNPITQSNWERLVSFGYHFIQTETGELASGATGPGRLAGTETIVGFVKQILLSRDDLKGKRILVTAGPTRESIDPIRFISNHSTGRMGFALAEEAILMGARVTLVSGPTSLHPPPGARSIFVTTAAEMESSVLSEWKDHDVLIMAAAVADFRAKKVSAQKMKKSEFTDRLILERTGDILKQAGDVKGDRIVVGFALETEHEIRNAQEKLKAKNADLICLNNPLEAGAGFAAETNKITLLDREGGKTSLPLMAKWEASKAILETVSKLLDKRSIHAD